MPTHVAIVTAAVIVAFLVFAFAVAWADYYSRDYRPSWDAKRKAQAKAGELVNR
ncbi:MAG: hypothetical protein HXY30_10760 [Pseudorhodoplanes sp.]|nr:hypothetical protein [Pseudorhodoplanes sp.]